MLEHDYRFTLVLPASESAQKTFLFSRQVANVLNQVSSVTGKGESKTK